MRTTPLAGLVLVAAGAAACTPDVVAGAYYCGFERSCPEGLACNGPDNICVLPSLAEPFDCAPKYEPDDTPEQGHELANLGCVSVPYVDENCLGTGDPADWVRFTAPAACTAVAVQARVAFPIAFAAVGLRLTDLDASIEVATSESCASGADDGDDERCLSAMLIPGRTYGLAVRTEGLDCGGACKHNRYVLSVQLVAP
jgi:hypothetical protein